MAPLRSGCSKYTLPENGSVTLAVKKAPNSIVFIAGVSLMTPFFSASTCRLMT
ncbi:hypothetical protein D3C72_2394050 [compost metagenome]